MKSVLLDTNILLDIALERMPFFEDAVKVFEKISCNQIAAYISATTITDLFYLLRKNKGTDSALQFLLDLVQIVKIIGIDSQIVKKALKSNCKDFEDAIQIEAAISINAYAIITRNIKDFETCPLLVFTPSQLIVNLLIRN